MGEEIYLLEVINGEIQFVYLCKKFYRKWSKEEREILPWKKVYYGIKVNRSLKEIYLLLRSSFDTNSNRDANFSTPSNQDWKNYY